VFDVNNFGQKQDSTPEWASDVDSIFSAAVFPLYTKKHIYNKKINFSIQYLQIFVLEAMSRIILAIKSLSTPGKKLVNLLAAELEFVINIYGHADISTVPQNRPLLILIISSSLSMIFCIQYLYNWHIIM
jgi:hypothetical protein